MKRSFVETIFLSGGTIINSVLGLFFYILVARGLGPAAFGQFSLLLGLGIFAAEISDWGFDSAIVRFGAQGNLSAVLGVAFLERFIILGLIGLIGLILSPIVHLELFISMLIAISLSFLGLITQSFLAKQRYFQFIGTNIFGNICRLIGTAALFYFGMLSKNYSLFLFYGANFLAFVFGFCLLWLISRSFPLDFSHIKVTLKKIIGFSNWMGATFAVNSAAAKIDVPLVYYFTGSIGSGIYSSAQRLNSVLPQIAAAVEGVFSPKFPDTQIFPRHFREYLLIAGLISVAIIILLPLSPFLITLVFGLKYLSAVPIFQVFLLGLVPFFLAGPFNAAVVYRFGKSQFNFIKSLLTVIVSVVLYLLLIPVMGPVGAAWTFVVTNALSLVLFVWYYFYVKARA